MIFFEDLKRNKLTKAICLSTIVLSLSACSQSNGKNANDNKVTDSSASQQVDAAAQQEANPSETATTTDSPEHSADSSEYNSESDASVVSAEGASNSNELNIANDSNNGQSQSATNVNNDINDNAPASGLSQQLAEDSKTATTLNKVLPTINYSTTNLSETAQKVNQVNWQSGTKIDKNLATKIQALLNWHHHGVGAVDGAWGKNTRKAMQAFQRANSLSLSEDMNAETWQALTADSRLTSQPVLVNYTLTSDDVKVDTTKIPAGAENKAKLKGMYYERLTEALAEKFHINENYLKALNPAASFKAGETITIYNPGNPNTQPVSKVVADKSTETLYAYDSNGNMVASYPTTVGSSATPSPSGTHQVKVKVHQPNYTYTAKDGSQSILPPGPNNPVGMVWIGLSKPSYGIHGSPDPEAISRQASSGCIRLTNWDALALYGTINDDATVEFK